MSALTAARKVRDRALPLARLGARRLFGGKTPFQVTLSLTSRCNFRCQYCHIPLQARDELSCEEWLAGIDELRAGGMGRASIIGGEPLLRPDVGAVLRRLRQHGVHASLNTNGWLVAERIEELADLDLVCLTLDGPEAIHDAQRHRGSYQRVRAAIDLLRQRGVPVVTMSVVTPAGLDHVDHVLEVARAHGITAYFQLEHGADMDVHGVIGPALSEERIAALAAHLTRRKSEGQPVGNSRAALAQQGRRRVLVGCDECHAGRFFGYVLADGTVAHCLLTQNQVERGNGRRLGLLRAFTELPPPRGPGCSCLPAYEVNRILDFDARVVFSVLDAALRGRLG